MVRGHLDEVVHPGEEARAGGVAEIDRLPTDDRVPVARQRGVRPAAARLAEPVG